MQLCWAYVGYTSFCCIDTACGNTNTKQAPPGTPPQLLHLLSGSRVVMDRLHLMDGSKCVRVLLFLAHLDLHFFSVVSLHCGVHSTWTGLSTHLHFHKYSGSDVSTHTLPSLTFCILPGTSLLPKAKEVWWPVK